MVEALVTPFQREDERHLQIGASIGIAVAPLRGSDWETLVTRADIALYAAKAAGKNTFRPFRPEKEQRMTQRVRLEAKRRQALEVTESARLEGQADGLGEPRRGLDLGVSIALDAFGTDFSSLAHLRAFPFDKIEIDGAFVRDATSRPDGAAILGVVADLGRRLGGIIVAEGVETEADPALVTAKDCIEVQGDLLGRPVPHPRDVEETDDRVAGAIRRRAEPRVEGEAA